MVTMETALPGCHPEPGAYLQYTVKLVTLFAVTIQGNKYLRCFWLNHLIFHIRAENAWIETFPQAVLQLTVEMAVTNTNNSFTGRELSSTQPIKTRSNWAVAADMLSSHRSFSPTVPLPLTHRPADNAHRTYITPFSSYHTDTQGSPSVGQWKMVAMAAHPEPRCRMIRGVMLLNQPPFSALHCCLYAII